jgi:hypothetical protein
MGLGDPLARPRLSIGVGGRGCVVLGCDGIIATAAPILGVGRARTRVAGLARAVPAIVPRKLGRRFSHRRHRRLQRRRQAVLRRRAVVLSSLLLLVLVVVLEEAKVVDGSSERRGIVADPSPFFAVAVAVADYALDRRRRRIRGVVAVHHAVRPAAVLLLMMMMMMMGPFFIACGRHQTHVVGWVMGGGWAWAWAGRTSERRMGGCGGGSTGLSRSRPSTLSFSSPSCSCTCRLGVGLSLFAWLRDDRCRCLSPLDSCFGKTRRPQHDLSCRRCDSAFLLQRSSSLKDTVCVVSLTSPPWTNKKTSTIDARW